jgi:hypothetical protein
VLTLHVGCSPSISNVYNFIENNIENRVNNPHGLLDMCPLFAKGYEFDSYSRALIIFYQDHDIHLPTYDLMLLFPDRLYATHNHFYRHMNCHNSLTLLPTDLLTPIQ